MSDAVRQAFHDQAAACDRLGSPFTARLLRLAGHRLARGPGPADTILDWPGDPRGQADSVPLRFAGALHFLALKRRDLHDIWPPATEPSDDDTLWRRVEHAMARHGDTLRTALTSPPQTNELARSAAIVPVLHMLARRFDQPLVLLELGASAALNLICDRYAVAAGATLYPGDDPVLTLRPDWTGPAPQPTSFDIFRRAGVDLRPIDIRDRDQRLRLLSYIWPDQAERHARIRAAMAVAPPCPDRVDAGDWLAQILPEIPDGCLPVVFHTIAWQYFGESTRAAAMAAMDDVGRTRPLAHIAMEADRDDRGAGLSVTRWPGPETHLLARVDFHGRWLDWTGPVSLG